MSAYENVVKLGQEKYGLQIGFKDESRLMKVLGWLLFFNPKFMTTYTTTIGDTVYFPSKSWLINKQETAAVVLAHELVHIADSREAGSVIFSYCYLTPQVFSLLSLIALCGNVWWLLCLLFLAPLPAPMRTYFELRGYALTDAARYKLTGNFADINFITSQFTTGAYFFMWPFKKDIENRVLANRDLIKRGKLSDKIDFADEIVACF